MNVLIFLRIFHFIFDRRAINLQGKVALWNWAKRVFQISNFPLFVITKLSWRVLAMLLKQHNKLSVMCWVLPVSWQVLPLYKNGFGRLPGLCFCTLKYEAVSECWMGWHSVFTENWKYLLSAFSFSLLRAYKSCYKLITTKHMIFKTNLKFYAVVDYLM